MPDRYVRHKTKSEMESHYPRRKKRLIHASSFLGNADTH
jgi:hypothetical protein